MSQRNIWSKLIDTMSRQHGWIYLCRKMWLQRISILLSCAWMYRCTISYINSIDLINIIQMWIMISENFIPAIIIVNEKPHVHAMFFFNYFIEIASFLSIMRRSDVMVFLKSFYRKWTPLLSFLLTSLVNFTYHFNELYVNIPLVESALSPNCLF